MEFNEKGFPYRMASLVQYQGDNSNICHFARQAVGGTLLFMLFITIISFFAILNVFSLITLFSSTPYAISGEVLGNLMFLANGILVFAVIAFGYLHLREEYDNYQYKNRKPEEYKPLVHKQPNLFVQWLRDKHDKICTTVTFVRE